MTERAISICGFPESGKTSYLAALWHLVTTGAEPTTLQFESLRHGDATHLNELAARWRNGLKQVRTEIASSKLVSMNLKKSSGEVMRLTLPDLSGESYRTMFEDRQCDKQVARTFENSDGMLLLVHADKIRQPHLVVSVVAQSQKLGSAIPDGQEVPWVPNLSPTQVQLVELLQLLKRNPLAVKLSRLAIVLSAWDKVADEGRRPDQFLAERLPLLQQYLQSSLDDWAWNVYGVSAQGGDYEKEGESLTGKDLEKLNHLKSLDEPSMRISVIHGGHTSSDLTEPIAWLIQ